MHYTSAMSVNPKTVLEDDRTTEPTTVDPIEVVTLLGDDYTREILETIGDESLSAREISERTDMSRPTVYRRINDLQDAGVVESCMLVDGDGHHKQAFELSINEVTVSVDDVAAKAA